MRVPDYSDGWPPSWRLSHGFDLMELGGRAPRSGYAYAYKTRLRHTLDLLQRAAPVPGKVLDIGAGQGNFSLTFAEMGYDVTWNDLRSDLVDYVRLKWERGRVQYRPGNILDLEPWAGFDVVVLAEAIEHVAHPDLLLTHAARFARPGGAVILTTPNGGYFLNRLPRFSECLDPSRFEEGQFRPDSDGHIFLLHVDELEMLAHPAALSIKELRLFANPLTSGHVKLGALLRILPSFIVGAVEGASAALPRALRRRLHAGMAVWFEKTG